MYMTSDMFPMISHWMKYIAVRLYDTRVTAEMTLSPVGTPRILDIRK